MHWLERCSGKGIDFDHADPRVWQQARSTAQQAVLAALQGRRDQRSKLMWSRLDRRSELGNRPRLHR
jgi:hypothetical protein